jgi:hypothetical protein
MTLKYWMKIVLGMVVIFAIGAFGVRTFRHGEAFLNSDRAIDVPMLGASFKLGGERLGKIQRLRIERSSPRRVSGVNLTVALDSSVAVSRFDGCALAITDVKNIDKNTSFVCAAAADQARLQLVPFGTVTIRDGNAQEVMTMPLLVPRSVVADLQQSFGNARGTGDTGNVDINGDSGSFHLRINGKDVISIVGDSAGGSVKVFDGKGRAIVDIAGDSNGGRVTVKDSTGKTRVNVKAANPPRKPNSP